MRYENWKIVFEEQRAPGTLRIWAEPFTKLRVPKMFDLRADPYERADITSNTYYDWFMSNGADPFMRVSSRSWAPFLATFKELSAEPAAVELQRFSDNHILTAFAKSVSPHSYKGRMKSDWVWIARPLRSRHFRP